MIDGAIERHNEISPERAQGGVGQRSPERSTLETEFSHSWVQDGWQCPQRVAPGDCFIALSHSFFLRVRLGFTP